MTIVNVSRQDVWLLLEAARGPFVLIPGESVNCSPFETITVRDLADIERLDITGMGDTGTRFELATTRFGGD